MMVLINEYVDVLETKSIILLYDRIVISNVRKYSGFLHKELY